MSDSPIFRSINLTNLLSFGSHGTKLEIEKLNVVIGENGSGKSNLIESFRILHSVPNYIESFSEPYPMSEWQWKGNNDHQFSIELIVSNSEQDKLLRYSVTISTVAEWGDRIVTEVLTDNFESDLPYLVKRTGRKATLCGKSDGGWYETSVGKLPDPGRSILTTASDNKKPAMWLREQLDLISLFRHFNTGQKSLLRSKQKHELNRHFLDEDGENLALVLNGLQEFPEVMNKIQQCLKVFYKRAQSIDVRVEEGGLVVRLREDGLTKTIPMSRLSDGTLRYLCLLVILCHPTPPPLICIEEPELGMHPDIIPTIAELLIEASERTQLIVTTHSSMLVSAIGQTHPDAVVVCERGENGTQMRRLDKEQLAPWLAEYSLGDIWMKGLIGGTRW